VEDKANPGSSNSRALRYLGSKLAVLQVEIEIVYNP